jgi:hypothetical protein
MLIKLARRPLTHRRCWHDDGVTQWEYARLEYRSTGTFGTDTYMDWDAVMYLPGSVQRWGTDERYDDLRHLNRAGAEGWQVYDRGAVRVGQPARLHAVTYSMKRPVS